MTEKLPFKDAAKRLKQAGAIFWDLPDARDIVRRFLPLIFSDELTARHPEIWGVTVSYSKPCSICGQPFYGRVWALAMKDGTLYHFHCFMKEYESEALSELESLLGNEAEA